MLAYLDDWITWAPNKVILQINLRKILSLLKNLGFMINYKKSLLTPASDITWLEVRWFLQEGLWDVPPSFKEKIFLEANQLLHARVVSRRSWESFTGKLAFLGQIHSHLRPNISLLSHPQYLAPARLRDKKVLLPEVLKGSLRTWSSPSMLPGPTPFLQPRLKIALWTDASLSGWGAHSDKGHYCQGLWSNQEETLHINTLEVLAVIRAIESLNLHNLHISLHIDNEVAKFVINKLRSKAAALYPYLTMLCLLRCSQQGPSPNDGMVSPHERLQQNHCLERRGGGGPNGDSPQQEGGDVRLSSPPSSSGSNRRQDGRLEHLEASLHLPSKEVHHPTSSQAPVVQIPRGVHRSLAAFSSLVPRTLPKGRRPLASARPARTIRSLRKSAKWLPKLRTLDRIQFLKEVYTATRGDKVASSLVHAFRKSSINHAETAWRAFKNWLPEHLTVLRKRHVPVPPLTSSQKEDP